MNVYTPEVDYLVGHERLREDMDIVTPVRQGRGHPPEIVSQSPAIGFLGREFRSDKCNAQKCCSVLVACGLSKLEHQIARLSIVSFPDDSNIFR